MTAARVGIASTEELEVLCCPLAALDSDLLARYEKLLSAEELRRLREFRSPAAAKEFLAGRALLRSALATKLHCDARDLHFTRNGDGKPALSQPASAWQFNLTHSHGWVALALCEGSSVGIDIESRSRRNNLRAIAQRFFSSEENALLSRCPEHQWLDYFLAIWTLKEAHAKALGCGLSKILSCSSIAVDLNAGTIALTLSDVAATARQVSSWLYRLDEEAVLAVIAHGDNFSEPRIYRCVPLQAAALLRIAIGARG